MNVCCTELDVLFLIADVQLWSDFQRRWEPRGLGLQIWIYAIRIDWCYCWNDAVLFAVLGFCDSQNCVLAVCCSRLIKRPVVRKAMTQRQCCSNWQSNGEWKTCLCCYWKIHRRLEIRSRMNVERRREKEEWNLAVWFGTTGVKNSERESLRVKLQSCFPFIVFLVRFHLASSSEWNNEETWMASSYS